MATRVLNVIATAYRATLEEQDDTVLWLTHAMKAAGTDLDVLLRGNAANYAVGGQDASGLAFGERRQTQPPRIDHDVARLVQAGVRVFVVEDDLRDRGIDHDDIVPGVETIARDRIPELFHAYDRVWHW